MTAHPTSHVRPAPPPVPDAPAGRSAVVIDLDDDPIPVQIAGRLFTFKGALSAAELADTLGPVQEQSGKLAGGDVDALADLMDQVMHACADLLVDQSQRDDWLALKLPVAALISADRPSVLGALMEVYTGRPLTAP